MQVFDDRTCALGEGLLWHPRRQELFWFDILEKRLMSKAQVWQFDEHISAAGWVDDTTLIMASETGLWHLDLTSGQKDLLTALEADDPQTRSNDGRADPYGGFWIGTMGKEAEPGLGAIYRYFKGELRVLFKPISISNSICFSPDGLWAYFSDTPTGQIMRVALDSDGWPKADAEVFLDLRAEGLNPDGSVVDAQGCLWNAQWGASRVACYGPDGLRHTLALPTSQVTCPAFGGPDLKTLYVTTAALGLEDAHGGMTFHTDLEVTGQAEHKVLL